LAVQGVIPADATSCVSGCGHIETAQHLFLSRPFFASLWQQVREWIGFVGVDSYFRSFGVVYTYDRWW